MKKKIIFARIHYTGLFGGNFQQDIFEDLLSIKNTNGFIESGNYEWYFSFLEKEYIDGKNYIIGEITKIIPKENIISVNKDTKEEETKTNEAIKDNQSLFIIYPKRHLIGFETSKTFTKKQFFSVFKKGFYNINSPTEPEFDLIFDEKFLMKRLTEFSKVSSAKFELKTTNPDSREEFKKLDDLFQSTNSESNNIFMKAKEGDSLEYDKKDSIIKQGLAMSSSGYGKGTIIGIGKNLKNLTIRTGDNNLKEIEVNESSTNDEVKRQIIFTFNTLK